MARIVVDSDRQDIIDQLLLKYLKNPEIIAASITPLLDYEIDLYVPDIPEIPDDLAGFMADISLNYKNGTVTLFKYFINEKGETYNAIKKADTTDVVTTSDASNTSADTSTAKDS